jgi:hypothetical protein
MLTSQGVHLEAPGLYGSEWRGAGSHSENCLYLKVWMPKENLRRGDKAKTGAAIWQHRHPLAELHQAWLKVFIGAAKTIGPMLNRK